MTSDSESPRRQPKGDKRARTRARLLESARELTREKGYENTTLEDIARHAGMTTGAIYNNFRNREDLYIALSDAYWPPIIPSVPTGSRFPEVLRELAAETIATVPDRRAAAVGFLTGRAYAMNHEDLRVQASKQTERSYDAGAAWLATAVEDGGLPLSPETMIRVIHALSEGLVLQRLLTPELVPDEVFYAAFDLLAGKAGAQQSNRVGAAPVDHS